MQKEWKVVAHFGEVMPTKGFLYEIAPIMHRGGHIQQLSEILSLDSHTAVTTLYIIAT